MKLGFLKKLVRKREDVVRFLHSLLSFLNKGLKILLPFKAEKLGIESQKR